MKRPSTPELQAGVKTTENECWARRPQSSLVLLLGIHKNTWEANLKPIGTPRNPLEYLGKPLENRRKTMAIPRNPWENNGNPPESLRVNQHSERFEARLHQQDDKTQYARTPISTKVVTRSESVSVFGTMREAYTRRIAKTHGHIPML